MLELRKGFFSPGRIEKVMAEDGKRVCRTVLLSDEPADLDGFDGGAHERVAEAIAELVKGEEGGETIGLEGDWGSGKSTIVRLLEKKFEADPAVFFKDKSHWRTELQKLMG